MASVRRIGNPVGAGITFGLLSFFAILTVRIIFRMRNTSADLPPGDLLDMLYFEFDLKFLGLGVLGGAFFGWPRSRSSSVLPRTPTLKKRPYFYLDLLVGVDYGLRDYRGTFGRKLLAGSLRTPPVGEILLRVVVFDLMGVLVLFVCSVAALKAAH